MTCRFLKIWKLLHKTMDFTFLEIETPRCSGLPFPRPHYAGPDRVGRTQFPELPSHAWFGTGSLGRVICRLSLSDTAACMSGGHVEAGPVDPPAT